MIENIVYKESLVKALDKVILKDGSVLVTGASGLIGSCLIDLLLLANETGRHFDVFAMGRNSDKIKKRFSSFKNAKAFHIIEQDVRKPLEMGLDLDYIFHGASNADPRSYALFPAETMLINIEGAINILEYCKGHPTTKALMMSTFEVYGKAGLDVFKESDFGNIDYNTIRSCYPESKRNMELLTRCYVEEYGVKAVIGRLSSIYGPTMAKDDSKAHAQFIRNGLKKENIVMKSKGEQRRTYCYVNDAVTGLIYVMAKGKEGEAYNIANDNSIVTIADVAHSVAKISGTNVVFELPDEIEKKCYSAPQNCILDNSKLKDLGWKGYFGIDEGMKLCLSILETTNDAINLGSKV